MPRPRAQQRSAPYESRWLRAPSAWGMVAWLGLSACRADGQGADPPRVAEADEAAVLVAQPRPPAQAAPALEREPSPQEAAPSGTPCGALACTRYPDAESALRVVLAREPQVLALGEAHALQGTEAIPSATVRFERQLLPLLAERGATELIVELLGPAQGCTQTVEAVREEQKQVVEKQAPTNQDRFVSLGHSARGLGIVPYILEPSCAEYDSVVKGGADGITRMLELIAQKTEEKLVRYWARNQRLAGAPVAGSSDTGSGAAATPSAESSATGSSAKESPSAAPPTERSFSAAQLRTPLVLAYGGALHNDIDVPEAKQKFTYGKSLVQRTSGKYIALDLIVPEYIKPTEVWQALPWYPHFDAANPPLETTLFQTDEHSYVLIFGRTPASAPAP